MSGKSSQVQTGERPSVPAPYLALQAKLEELEHYTDTVLLQFPKYERHLLSADIRRSVSMIQRLTIVAWKRYHKKTSLQDLDIEVEVLRGWLRKALRAGHIRPHRYEVWARHVNDVGRMVGGWIKSLA